MKPAPGQFQFAAYPLGPDTYHEPGTKVARPATASRCWGVVGDIRGRKVPKPYGCRARCRHQALTCHQHRMRNDEAAALKAELEKGDVA